jgi:hypothetical protein
MTEGLSASRCEPRREIRGAEYETDVRRSEEQILLKMVIYPNAIVDHHFDGLNFLFKLASCLSSAPAHQSAFHFKFMV